jgi:hypothetical protein
MYNYNQKEAEAFYGKENVRRVYDDIEGLVYNVGVTEINGENNISVLSMHAMGVCYKTFKGVTNVMHTRTNFKNRDETKRVRQVFINVMNRHYTQKVT